MTSPKYKTLQARDKRSAYAVVIPVVNEGSRFHALLGRMQQLTIFDEFDVVVVDGISSDNTLESDVLAQYDLAAVLQRVTPGKLGTQLQCAYSWASNRGYKGVITIDGNNKDNPEKISEFAKLLDQGLDFVQGSRFISGGSHANTPFTRWIAIRLIHAPILSMSSGFKWSDTTQGFRGYSMKLINDSKLNIFRTAFSDYKLLFFVSHRAPKLGFRCIETGTERKYPIGEPVPTKIRGLRGNLKVLRDLFLVASGTFD